MKNNLQKLVVCILAVCMVCAFSAAAVAKPIPGSLPGRPGGPAFTPQPATVDQIVHNIGNIALTVYNFGDNGGYGDPGFPSGEWPRGSGHDYLANILYWAGAVVNGDTIVANSYDDFQGLPASINGESQYRIMLSTDTTRYYDYDITDTVGQGYGEAAHGWRVWNADTVGFVYNNSYNSLSAAFAPGGPTSLQDSHYRFSDGAGGSSVLGLELTQTVYQWNFCYNEDFLFFVVELTNTSTVDYTDFAFGLYIDIDVGGEDGSGENGRLEDLVAFDSTENLAWIYDAIGQDPGWGPTVQTGMMGTKLLETPDNIGMTSFRTDDWANFPDNDGERFALINSAQYDQSLPPTDQFYIQSVRGISLEAGKTVRVVYALVAGQDETDFRDNASLAQQLYDSYFVGPEPPAMPTLNVRAGDRKAYLNWDDLAELSTDPLTGDTDFVGYKLYRSNNLGMTWGIANHNTGNNCLVLDYSTVAMYAVNNAGDPIPRSFIDTGLHNGVEYWYCLAAFDGGDSVTGVDPLQSGFGTPGQTANTISVTPGPDPAGFFNAASTVLHNYTGSQAPSEGSVVPIVFDDWELTGSNYSVVFEDTPSQSYWHLINETTGDTVLANQTRYSGEAGLYEVAEGIRVVVRNGDRNPVSIGQTSLGGADTNLVVASFYGPTIPALTGDVNDVFGDAHYRSTYELRYTGDSSLASWTLDGFYGTDYPYWVPFEAWNVTTNQRVSLAVYDFDLDDDFDPYDLLTIVNYPYDSLASVTDSAFPEYYSWMLGFDETVYNPTVGDIYTVQGAPMNSPQDNFSFSIDGINAAAATQELDEVLVVPNPYLAQYSAEVERDNGESALEFQNIPDECTIRIYTMSGDLVTTIEHTSGEGSARWDLLSSANQQIASGIYLYHIESAYGEKLGRFAVIK